ncbi:MAG TPA: DUF3696 domain-containing protein [Planctomycetota bacterium]|nr:DUF3696 domain-containing protein [Planctomycetota bacterium]
MDSLIIEGVRCFSERQTVRLRPITLLTGENSTGKSTVLALARIAWHLWQGNTVPDFNEEPFILGAYDDLATCRGRGNGRVASFAVGAEFRLPSTAQRVRVSGQFVKKDAQPTLSEWLLETTDTDLNMAVHFEKEGTRLEWHHGSGSGSLTLAPTQFAVPPTRVWGIFASLPFESARDVAGVTMTEGARPGHKVLAYLGRLASGSACDYEHRPYAFAPIRTRPLRTYDPLRAEPEPEGRHVPMILATLSLSAPERWARLREALGAFGRQAGLWRDVEVRHLGGAAGPFQIRVKISGPYFNLTDVGYGVSQALPIVVDTLRGDPGTTYLLQEPEVHLHPSAQAQLGSLFASLAKEDDKRFLIETHSDHLVDRIRMEVRKGGLLKPEDVSLLYFERKNGGVRIHQLELDELGNILKPPRGYRQFFLDEMRALLGG